MVGPLSRVYIERYPAEAARVLEDAAPEAAAAVLADTPPAAAARLLRAMSPFAAAAGLARLESEAAAILLALLDVEHCAGLLRLLAPDFRNELTAKLPAKLATPLRRVMRFPPGSVGSLLEPQVVTAHPDTRIGELAEISRHAPELLRNYVYVLDENQRLIGVVGARDCVLREPERPVGAFVRENPEALRARASLREASRAKGWDRFPILPVTDAKGLFLGIVRRPRLLEALAAESATGPRENLADLAFEMADLYWSAAASLLVSALGAEPGPEIGPGNSTGSRPARQSAESHS